MSSKGYVGYQSWLFLSLCHDVMLLHMHYVLMLYEHACYDGATT